jgi:prepilin-type N-terminal cleavage/methylation domain-containing protein
VLFFKKLAQRASLSKGFTLVELLVVIAIIGVLSTLLLLQLNVARAKARDAKRVADINQVRSALELYFDDNGYYYVPADSTYATTNTALAAYLVRFPTDPGRDTCRDYGMVGTANGGSESVPCYGYAFSPSTQTTFPTRFHLWVELEQKAVTALNNDLDFDSTDAGAPADWTDIGGAQIDGSGAETEACTSSSTVDCIYDLGQPN